MTDTTRVALAMALNIDVSILLDARRMGLMSATTRTRSEQTLKVQATYIDPENTDINHLTVAQREGRKIKELRVARGISRSMLAAAAGLTRDYVGNVERGERSISSETREIFATVLNTTVTELLKASGIIDDASVIDAEIHEAIKRMPLSDLLTIKYGEHGTELAPSIVAILT